MLFGKKQETQELEEKLKDCNQQYEELYEKIKKAKELSKDTAPCFESQIAAQSEMDKQLTKVVASAHQSIATSQESQKAIEKLSTELIAVRSQIEEEEETKQHVVEALDGYIENLLSYAGDSDKNETLVQQLTQTKDELQEDLKRTGTTISDMKALTKQMSVLCLHNAVEASRMGENSRQLVESAQQVQQFAEEYTKAAVRAADQLQKMEKCVRQMEEQLGKITDGVHIDSQAWKDFTEKLEEQVQTCGRLSQNRFSDKLYMLSTDIRLLMQNQEGIQSLQQNTLSEMENIGESFMDEQEARKELERVFDSIIKTIE